ncbi:MAG: transketolase C-terminal domain-containing protein, partial [Bdellovibrionota bacterium]
QEIDGTRIFGDKRNPRLFLIALGSAAQRAHAAWEKLLTTQPQVALGLTSRFKPISAALKAFMDLYPSVPAIVVEDGVKSGGFGSNLFLELKDNHGRSDRKIKILTFKDQFIEHGPLESLEKEQGVSADDIYKEAMLLLST